MPRVASSPPEQNVNIFLKMFVQTSVKAPKQVLKYKSVKMAAKMLPPTEKPVFDVFFNFEKNITNWAWDAILGMRHEKQNI